MSLDAPAKTNPPNISMNLIFPETGHWPTFLLLIGWVYLHSYLCSGLQKTHLFCNRVLAKNGFWRQIATQVIHFAISYRPTTGSISPYNIAGHISEDSEEVATQITKNCCRRQPRSHLMPPPRGTPTNIPVHLIFPETRIISLHFCRW